MPSSVRSWLGPSAAAACAGALVAGVVEGAWSGVRVIAAAGFVVLVAWPALFIASVIARGLYAGWQPGPVGLVEDGGGSPRLAGWIATLWLAMWTLGWAALQGTWLLSAWTSFKPLTVGFAAPILVVGTALVLVIVSRPAARMFASLARRFDARWRKRGWRTLLTPRKIGGTAVIGALAVGYVLWRVLARPRFGPVDVSILYSPAAGIAAMLVVHAAWRALGRARVLVGAGLASLAGVTIAAALVAQLRAPRLTLAIWGNQPIAGLAIDRLFDTGAIRGRVSLANVVPVAMPGAAHPDVLLVVIDTVRADHTPPYGGRAAMPVLRELGLRGAVFSWAFAPSNDTPRSIASLMIGVAPHRVRGDLGPRPRLDPRHIMLAERLRAAGYETAGFMCCELWRGIGHGYEHLELEPSGAKLGDRARTWIEQREQLPGRRPLFVTLHVDEPGEWTRRLSDSTTDADRRGAYDASLTAADAIVKDVVTGFARSAPIVIVTSDHGEGLGDHDHPAHGTDLYNSQLRVPLVIAGPGIKAQHIAETVSLVDLAPTILELAGFRAPRDLSIDGRSLADLASGRRLSTPDAGTAFAMMPGDDTLPASATLIRGRYKLIDNGRTHELYDLQADPNERANVITAYIPLGTELRVLLDARKAAAARSPF